MIKKFSFLFFLIVCEIAYADCVIPEKISNKDILALVSGSYSPENPMAGQVYRMNFLDNGTYSYQTLKDGKKYSGTYTYEVVRKDIGVIKARETYDDVPVEYRMVMMCNNEKSGSYSYQQKHGINDMRTNSALYFFMEDRD